MCTQLRPVVFHQINGRAGKINVHEHPATVDLGVHNGEVALAPGAVDLREPPIELSFGFHVEAAVVDETLPVFRVRLAVLRAVGARNAEEADQTGAVLVLSLVFAEFVDGTEISQGAGEPVLVGDLHRVFDTIERHGELRHHAFDEHSVEVHAVVPHVEVASVALLNLLDRCQKVVRDRLVLHLPHFSGRVVDGITPQKDFCLRVFSVLMSTEFDRRLAEGL